MSAPSTNSNRDDHHPLTRREQEILALIAAGRPTPAIAEQLGITPGTVKAHISSVYRKLRIQNRAQATRYYLEQIAPRSEG